MTFEEIRKRNAERKQIMQSRSGGIFAKFVNHKDSMVVKLVPPFEGFDRLVLTMDGKKKKLKPHYRFHVIGDYNFETKHPLSTPRLELTAKDVRALKDENAKIWTAPYNATVGIQDQVDREHSFLLIQRNGVAKSPNTIYTVLYALQIEDQDWKHILPKIPKEELAKLQSEEQFNEISAAELIALQNLGVKEEDE